jgi:hypothetical protein
MTKLIGIALAIVMFAYFGYIVFTDIGVATCGLKDTVNNCIDDKYEIGEKSTLNVNYNEGKQYSPNFVQRTTRNTNFQGGRYE